MTDNAGDKPVNLTIIGRGIEVDKIQKRLRCAARATNIKLQLSWQHEYPPDVGIGAQQSIALSYDNKLLLDGLVPTEEIETLLMQLQAQIKRPK